MKKIITTRPEEKAELSYSSDCFELVNIPVTKLVVNHEIDTKSILNFKPTLGVFTSTKGVEIFLSVFKGRYLQEMRVVAIGHKTAGILSSQYSNVQVPAEKTSRGVNKLLDQIIGKEDRIALFTSAKSNGIILEHIQSRGWRHMEIKLYDAVVLDTDPIFIEASKEDCLGIVITSSMEARAIFGKDNLKDRDKKIVAGTHIFAIGATTEETLKELGIPISKPIGKSNLKEMLKIIEETYCQH
jgi:uroporphyrinogen-III synthase